MATNKVTMSQFRQNLGKLVHRAAYGEEPILLLSYGEPIAALIGVKDLQSLERLRRGKAKRSAWQGSLSKALKAADEVRDRIRNWQKKHRIRPEDSADSLEKLRRGRDEELSGLR